MLSKTGLFIAFCALDALDYSLTRRILAAGGFEANRLLRWAYRRAGPAGIALVKAAGVVVLAVLMDVPSAANRRSGHRRCDIPGRDRDWFFADPSTAPLIERCLRARVVRT